MDERRFRRKMMKARLIYNPTSGQEIIKKYIADILDKLEQYGYEPVLIKPQQNKIPQKKRRQEQQKLALI